MRASVVDRYAGYLPSVVVSAIKALDSKPRLALLGALEDHGPLTFKDLKDMFGMNQGTLSRHLTELERGGLAANYLSKSPHGYVWSFYERTRRAGDLISALLGVVERRVEFNRADAVQGLQVEGTVDVATIPESSGVNTVVAFARIEPQVSWVETMIPAAAMGGRWTAIATTVSPGWGGAVLAPRSGIIQAAA